jgi:hypothetical protein
MLIFKIILSTILSILKMILTCIYWHRTYIININFISCLIMLFKFKLL